LSLRARVAVFRELLHANNQALGYLAEIQQTLAGERPATAREVQRLLAGVSVQTYRMITNLARMTGRPQPQLERTFARLREAITRKAEVVPTLKEVGLVVPLDEVDASLVEVVGQKSGFLGEARRVLGGRVPQGVATTVHAYEALLAADGLGDRLAAIMSGVDAESVEACFAASAQATQAILAARVPAELEQALRQAVAALPGGDGLKLAVRSSALQEGGPEMSFAGQYRSLLNVERSGVVDAFKEVVASKYSPEAITYRLRRGFADAEVAMCCCILTMVPARAAGVLYSANRTARGAAVLVQAVRGLGLAAVDGSAAPDSLLVDRRSLRVVERRRGEQREVIRAAASGGTERVSVAPAGSAEVLTDAEAVELARVALDLERVLGMPVDMEWALDAAGAPWVLQVRPQPEHGEEAGAAIDEPVAGTPVLVGEGSRVSGGAAAGPVHRVESDLDILRCPAGAVLVTREARPRLAVLLPRVAAVVADMGEVTGHLATVARELAVPALFATRRATELLPPGEVVTVDADAGVVYRGRVEEALARAAERPRPSFANPNVERLAAVAELIVPLTLRDRLASGYSPGKCKTLHDIIRYCHQATVEAMFSAGDRASRAGERLYKLVSEVPIDCRLLDLGGAVRAGVEPGEITLAEVTSRPLRALWRGMTDPRVAWNVTKPVSLKGFASAIVNYNFDQDARLRAMGEPSYVFASDEYLNLNSRIGYHFSTVDASITEREESNYASFRFVGGSTGIDQRSRRAELIRRLLAARGFETDCRADLVNGRVRFRPAAEMEELLVYVGLLMTYVNHLDMVLISDALVEQFAEAFLAGNYGFKGEVGGAV
jgi:pyruvate,water dikinase